MGFKVVTLFWSFMFLLISFYFFYDKKKKYLSYLIVLFLLFNHSFLFNSMNGTSDIVFSSLFLFSLFFFKLAQRNKNYYYIVESRLIKGKVKQKVLCYLGTANNLLKKLQVKH